MPILNSIISFITTYSLDVAIVFGLFVFLFWYGLWYEKHRLTSMVLSFYTAFVLFNAFPYLEKIYILGDSGRSVVVAEALLFLFFVIISILVFNRVIKGRFPASGMSRWFNIGVLSLSATGLLCAISVNVFPSGELYSFAEPIALLFISMKNLFYWMIAPLVVLYIISRPAV